MSYTHFNEVMLSRHFKLMLQKSLSITKETIKTPSKVEKLTPPV